MFERFTERARKVMILSQEEAHRMAHNYIGTEHLLLGLLREDEGVAAEALSRVEVTLNKAREQVESIVGYGEEDRPITNNHQASFTPRSKKVLELVLREASQFGHEYISTEHILFGLIRESEGVAVQILLNLGTNFDEIRHDVSQAVDESSEFDSLDLVEAEMEDENTVELQTISLPPTSSLRASVRVKGRVRTLLLYLNYAESVSGHSGTTDPGEFLSDVAETLENAEYRSLKVAVLRSGELVLERFPRVREVEVNALRERFSERSTGSGMILSATFRR